MAATTPRTPRRRCGAIAAAPSARPCSAAPSNSLADGGGERATPLEPVLGLFGEGLEEHVVEVRQVRAVVAEPGRILVQMLADHRDRVGVLERRRAGE